jgi:hypothetical protein
MSRRIFSFVTGIACLSITSFAAAQANPPDSAEVTTLSKAGDRALEHNEFAKAAQYFERAEARSHSPLHLIGWGKALLGLGQTANAYKKFDLAARAAAQSNSPQSWQQALTEAQAELSRLRPKLAWLTITVTGPVEPKVAIEDDKVPLSELGNAYPVEPGKRTVVVSGLGFETARRSVSLQAGKSQQLDFILRSSDKTATAASDSEEMRPAALYQAGKNGENTAEDDALRGRRALGYAALGIGGAGLLAGGVFGAIALDKRSDLKSACGSTRSCPSNQEETIDAYHRYGTLSGVGFAFALAGIGTYVTLLVTEPKAASNQKQQAFKCAPYIGLGTLGATGKF